MLPGRNSGVTATVPASPESPDLSEAAGQVVSAWLSAEQAFDTAALTSDADEPDLAVTTVSPQLAWTRSLLARMKASGQIARGQIRFGSPTVTWDGTDRATVRSCAHDAEIVMSATTGVPAAGVPGQVDFELFLSTMTLTDGEWKLSTQQVGVGGCDRL